MLDFKVKPAEQYVQVKLREFFESREILFPGKSASPLILGARAVLTMLTVVVEAEFVEAIEEARLGRSSDRPGTREADMGRQLVTIEAVCALNGLLIEMHEEVNKVSSGWGNNDCKASSDEDAVRMGSLFVRSSVRLWFWLELLSSFLLDFTLKSKA